VSLLFNYIKKSESREGVCPGKIKLC